MVQRVEDLSDDQQARLTQQLDDYLVSLENGQPLDANELARNNPDIADVFASYLEKLDALYGVAVGFSDPSDHETLDKITSGKMKLGDFTIQQEIGRGGMGVVYEATQESLSRRVAIKLLPITSLLDSQQIARFKNEAHAAGLLNHPNIVPVYSVGTERGLHYYAMQFIDGISLDAWAQNRSLGFHPVNTPPQAGSLGYGDWKVTLGWIIDVARALHAAHETGVVHRDVKPSNLMLDQQGKVWITDFGLARCQTDVSLTNSGDLVGTMRYMSPEQARGQHALVDGRTDVYSLAATAYELLTFRPAHDGEDAPAIMKMISEQEITPLRQLRNDLPRDLETVLAKAMSKSRDGRYETAEAFADDLARVLADEPTVARPPTLVDRVGRFASKHRIGVLSAVMVGLMGLVGFATSTAIIATWKQASDDNAARATRNEHLARGAVDRLGSQMAELLAGIPSADPVRRALLTETLHYYETFAASADNDPALKEDLAITFGKIGTLQSELGETEQAIEALRRSETLYGELAERDERDNLDWPTSQNNLAQALANAGRLEDAAKYFSRAITTQRKILASVDRLDTASYSSGQVRPDEQVVKRALATSLNNLGLLLADSLANGEAEEAYLEAISLLQPDAQAPLDIAGKQQLATVLSNLSGLLTKQSPDRASDYARQALAQQTDALESDPSNAKLATQVIVTLNTLGASQSAGGYPEDAIETLSRAVDVGNQLLARWPDQPTYRRDLVVSLNHLGLAYCKVGNVADAKLAFQTALEQGRPLAATFSNDAETQSMLGGVLNNLGFLQLQLGDIAAAASTYDEAIAAQSSAVQLAPEVKRYRQYLRKHKENRRTVTGQETAS
ncbi:serine/threonine-protein kinase [Novipirellula aureliae]|nr:serine/threonine-protein kinase [Novipirellula aureliae]